MKKGQIWLMRLFPWLTLERLLILMNLMGINMTIKNGDLPAMPISDTPIDTGYASRWLDNGMIGLTKREMIAMHVAPAIYNLYCTDGTSVQFPEWRQGVVIESVRLADLLLDELERTK